MQLNVPKSVAAYLTAEQAKDADALSKCFLEEAIVHDEGKEYHGRAAIRTWKSETDKKYPYELEPVSTRTDGDKLIVRARLEGDFPGSPVELDHVFTLTEHGIASLEIHP